MNRIIHLEDQGQDLLRLVLDKDDRVIREEPINRGIFKGGFVPDSVLEIGCPCPMHLPPDIEFGYLKYTVVNIEDL